MYLRAGNQQWQRVEIIARRPGGFCVVQTPTGKRIVHRNEIKSTRRKRYWP